MSDAEIIGETLSNIVELKRNLKPLSCVGVVYYYKSPKDPDGNYFGIKMVEKPSWLRRFIWRIVNGWVWEDYKDE